MKQTLFLVLCTLAVALGWDSGFRVRFGLTGIGKDHYIALPQTRTEAVTQGWSIQQRPDKVLPSLTMLCHPNLSICVLYQDTGFVGGIQIAIPAGDFKEAVWDWETQGYIKWTASNGKTFWTKHQYFVNEPYLATSAAQRRANRNPKSLLSAGGSVWISGNRAELFEITPKPDSLLANGFTKQGCIPGMGTHYWRLNKTSECNSESFPFFALYDNNNDLVGTGLSVPGKLAELQRDWFERPPPLAVKLVVPRGPECVQTLAKNPGYLTIHIYYVESPWLNVCLPKLPSLPSLLPSFPGK